MRKVEERETHGEHCSEPKLRRKKLWNYRFGASDASTDIPHNITGPVKAYHDFTGPQGKKCDTLTTHHPTTDTSSITYKNFETHSHLYIEITSKVLQDYFKAALELPIYLTTFIPTYSIYLLTILASFFLSLALLSKSFLI